MLCFEVLHNLMFPTSSPHGCCKAMSLFTASLDEVNIVTCKRILLLLHLLFDLSQVTYCY